MPFVSPNDLSVLPFASLMTDEETHFPESYRPLVTEQPMTAKNVVIDSTQNQSEFSEYVIGTLASLLLSAMLRGFKGDLVQSKESILMDRKNQPIDARKLRVRVELTFTLANHGLSERKKLFY